jgi:YihY family inner membrane protein
MSTATRVPETSRQAVEELSADDAAAVLRRVGRVHLLRDSFRRFRYADGFTSARALGFQFVLSFIPLVIAFVGLSSSIRTESLAEAVRRTLLELSPGSGTDAVTQALERGTSAEGSGGRVALAVGLVTALMALTTSMGQLERAANRIYGIQRDRPARQKYLRAALLAVGGGIPAMLGFLVLVAGGRLLAALDAVYNWGNGLHTAGEWLRWPLGALLDLLAITVIFRWAPRRKQPQMSWLAFGAGLALVLWLLFTGLFALYVTSSGSFGAVYGPLTGIVALLLWSQLTSVALLLGVSFGAQLEAVRAGVPSPVAVDPEAGPGADHRTVVVLAPEPRTTR